MVNHGKILLDHGQELWQWLTMVKLMVDHVMAKPTKKLAFPSLSCSKTYETLDFIKLQIQYFKILNQFQEHLCNSCISVLQYFD